MFGHQVLEAAAKQHRTWAAVDLEVLELQLAIDPIVNGIFHGIVNEIPDPLEFTEMDTSSLPKQPAGFKWDPPKRCPSQR